MAISDDKLTSAVNKNWKQMLALWMKVVLAPDIPSKASQWKAFKCQYSNESFKVLIAYIKCEWLNWETAHKFLHCFTSWHRHVIKSGRHVETKI
jgi:hypothetical protein